MQESLDAPGRAQPVEDQEIERAWLAQVRPAARPNPVPKPVYDLVVLGAGTAGLVAAAGAALLGARVALVERDKLGGDCLNTGCVPSKALLHVAREAKERRKWDQGFDAAAAFPGTMRRVREKRARIAPHDSVARVEGYGADVFLGRAAFTDRNAVEVDGATLRFRKAIVATGGMPALPAIPGLAATPHQTHESLFEITSLPARITVIGGGPIGCELGQAFQRLGSRVTIVQSHERILEKEDEEAAGLVAKQLRDEGVRIVAGAGVLSVQGSAERQTLLVRTDGGVLDLESDLLLVAAGRKPNVQDLGLERAGIAYDVRGIGVDDRLRTSNPRVFACGDVASRFKFTHAAEAQARLAVRNALLFGRKRASRLIIPRVTYTDPEIAQVGMTRREAEAASLRIRSIRIDFSHLDRSIVEEEESGFAEAVVEEGAGRILGVTIAHRLAGELISEATLAISMGIDLPSLSDVIHPYPTRGEILKKLGDAYQRTRLTSLVKKILRMVIKM